MNSATRSQLTGLCFSVMLASAVTAFAAPLTNKAIDAFVGLKVGSTLKAVPKGNKVSGECVQLQGKLEDCEFYDKTGIRYLISNGILYSKTAKLNNSYVMSNLGLAGSENVNDLSKKIFRKLKVSLEKHENDGMLLLDTNYVTTKSCNEACGLFFKFNKMGELNEVSIESEVGGD